MGAVRINARARYAACVHIRTSVVLGCLAELTRCSGSDERDVHPGAQTILQVPAAQQAHLVALWPWPWV